MASWFPLLTRKWLYWLLTLNEHVLIVILLPYTIRNYNLSTFIDSLVTVKSWLYSFLGYQHKSSLLWYWSKATTGRPADVIGSNPNTMPNSVASAISNTNWFLCYCPYILVTNKSDRNEGTVMDETFLILPISIYHWYQQKLSTDGSSNFPINIQFEAFIGI